MPTRIAVIMAGGAGERFWPVSKPGRPKQLLRLTSTTENMLEEAVSRVEPLLGKSNVYLATSKPLAETVALEGLIPSARIFAEPAKRNTLGCLCWVAAKLLSSGLAEATVGVLTADHKIGEPEKFRETISAAMAVAESEQAIVTMGVQPDRPETGFGYIEINRQSQSGPAFAVKRFREKPNEETAAEFLASGDFLWNSGMFFFPLRAFLRDLEDAQPAAHVLTVAIAEALGSGDVVKADALFEQLPSISIDYAVMEHAKRVFVIPADFPWDDLGSWDALERTLPHDLNGNVQHGRAIIVDSEGSIIYNASGLTVGVLGLQDMVVVVTEDSVLVCPKDQAQRVREIAQKGSSNPQKL